MGEAQFHTRLSGFVFLHSTRTRRHSVESLAEEQLSIDHTVSQAFPEPKAVYYVPVVVTNTELVVCHFEPQEVDLSEGVLQDHSGEFEAVSFIRFRKSFTTRFATTQVPTSLKEVSEDNQRTVFVVHSPSLPDFLEQWDLY
jgi:hypothetical protein